MGNINNINSTVTNQVLGTMNIGAMAKDDVLRIVDSRLAELTLMIQADRTAKRADVENALREVTAAKRQLASPNVSVEAIERSLGVAANIASVATLIDQIRPFLCHLL